jgi:hypothetical protein
MIEMTAMEAANELFEYFESHKILSLKNQVHYKQLAKIEGTNSDEVARKLSYQAGLKILENDGLVVKVTEGKEDFWILNQDFDLLKQSVEISGVASLFITKTINILYSLTKRGKVCSSRNIQQDDLVYLANACSNFIEESLKQAGGENQNEGT